MTDERQPGEEVLEEHPDMAVRRGIFYARLATAEPFRGPDEALAAIAATLTAVEDEFSGIPADPNPGLDTGGRMYPPQQDRIDQLPDGSLKAEAQGHTILLGIDGSVTITRRHGEIEFAKAGQNDD